MASLSTEQNLLMSIFSIEVSKGPRPLPMRKGTASVVNIEGSSSTYLLTCRKVVEYGGASSIKLSCKRFCPSPQEEKHRIDLNLEPIKIGEFGFIPFRMTPFLRLVSADKLRKEGEMMRKSTCLSFTFFGNSWATMKWEFSNDEGAYVLTSVDPEGELVESACKGSPVVSAYDKDHSVIGVVDCTSEGDLNLVFFEETSLRDLEAKLGERCSDKDEGNDVTDSPCIPRDSPLSAPPLANEEESSIGIRNRPQEPGAAGSNNYMRSVDEDTKRPPEENDTPHDVALKNLTRTLSNTGIQETDLCENNLPSKKKTKEIVCLWNQELQSLTYFQDLLTNILKINLDPKRPLGGDYESLAGALGKNMKYIWHLGTQPSPVGALLKDCPSLTLKVLTRLLSSKEVKRLDVVKEIKTWVDNQGCNCSECGSLR